MAKKTYKLPARLVRRGWELIEAREPQGPELGHFKAFRRLANGSPAYEGPATTFEQLLRSLEAAGEDRTGPVPIQDGVRFG